MTIITLARSKNKIESLKIVHTNNISTQAIKFPTITAVKLCNRLRFVKQATADPVQIPVIGAGIATNSITASHMLKVLCFLTFWSSSSTLCFLNFASSFAIILAKVLVFFSLAKTGFRQLRIINATRLLPKKLARKETNGESADAPHTSVAMPKGKAILASHIGTIAISITAKKLPPILLNIFCILSTI